MDLGRGATGLGSSITERDSYEGFGLKIAMTLPVAGSIFLTGDAAPCDP